MSHSSLPANHCLTAQRDRSRLVFVDLQVKLSGVMDSDAMQKVSRNCSILAQAASLLDIPQVYTEQYPRGLGHTLPELKALLSTAACVEKTAFACSDEPAFNRQLTADHPQIILAGMEAHICILQTALGLQAQGKQVFVVADAVISRDPANKANALDRLRQAGIILTNTESVVFEWLAVGEGDAFRQISKLIR
ncbi:MAG: isochorismatase family protein [Candidatus Methylopumilus sp.]|jgi:isochorismate hydrolase